MSTPRAFRIRNWSKFQHYKDRNPPWIKLHCEIFGSEDWVMLDDASKLLAIVCMVIAAKHDGEVPNNPDYIRRVAYLNAKPDLSPLLECGFLENVQAVASARKQEQAIVRPEKETEAEAQDRDRVPLAKANGRPAVLLPLAPAPLKPDPWRDVYGRGKEILGREAGGIITKLRKLLDDKPRKVLAKLEDAAEQREPLAWLCAFLAKVDDGGKLAGEYIGGVPP